MKNVKILLTAFDPFGGEDTNAVLEALRLISDTIDGATIKKLVVPTVFYKASDMIKETARSLSPDAIVMLGQAKGRGAITPERVAINVIDASIDDNEGNRPKDARIIDGAPDGYFSTLPIKDMADAIKSEGISAAVSNSAGTFVCNQTMFSVLHFSKEELPNAKVGFIHIPCTPTQANEKTPSMATSDAVRGIEAALRSIIKNITNGERQ
jgi:pyroglutamyl-peptidase